MKEHICIDEGISINVSETEDVCPYCNGEIIDIDAMEKRDWMEVIEILVDDFEVDDYLNVIKEIKKLKEEKQK